MVAPEVDPCGLPVYQFENLTHLECMDQNSAGELSSVLRLCEFLGEGSNANIYVVESTEDDSSWAYKEFKVRHIYCVCW